VAVKKNRAPKTTKPEVVATADEAVKPAKAAKAPKAPKAPKVKKPKVKACAEKGCRKPGISQGFCRLHYFANWRLIKEEDKLRAERRLNAYVDRLAKRYPSDYLEKIKEGIESEETFKKTMEQLELDAAADDEPETEREYLERMVRNAKPED
jgi:hypothetical protein